MAILSIAGVAFPVLINSLGISGQSVGSTVRNQAGWTLMERRREKKLIEFSTGPKPLDEAQLYRMLVLGEGEFWNTQVDLYGSKGYALAGTGAINTADSNTNPLTYVANGAWKCTTTQTLVIPTSFYDQSALLPSALIGAGTWTQGAAGAGWSLVGWRRDATAGNYRIFAMSGRRKDAAPTYARERIGNLGSSGAAQTFTGTETLSTSTTALTLTMPGTGGPWYFSNLMVLPWFLPVAQLDQLMAGWALTDQALPALPRVLVQSDLFPSDQQSSFAFGLHYSSVLVCTGQVHAQPIQPATLAGTFTKTLTALAASLTEV